MPSSEWHYAFQVRRIRPHFRAPNSRKRFLNSGRLHCSGVLIGQLSDTSFVLNLVSNITCTDWRAPCPPRPRDHRGGHYNVGDNITDGAVLGTVIGWIVIRPLWRLVAASRVSHSFGFMCHIWQNYYDKLNSNTISATSMYNL
jgi:hypothetical protein